MSSINEELLKSINEFISSQSSNVDKKELLEVIKDVFSKHKKSKKDESSEKPKRKPSAYNIFMKKSMEELKDNGMTAKEKMKRVAELWKEYKALPQKNEEIEEVEEKEEQFVDVEETTPEPVPEPEEKKGKNKKNNDNSKMKKK